MQWHSSIAKLTILEYKSPPCFHKTLFQKYPIFSNMASGAVKRTLYLQLATYFHDSLVIFSPVIAIAFMLRFSIWWSYLSMSVHSKIQSTWSCIKAVRGDTMIQSPSSATKWMSWKTQTFPAPHSSDHKDVSTFLCKHILPYIDLPGILMELERSRPLFPVLT